MKSRTLWINAIVWLVLLAIPVQLSTQNQKPKVISVSTVIDERKTDHVEELFILTGGHCIAPGGLLDGNCIGHIGRYCQTKPDQVHCPVGAKAKNPGVTTCCILVTCGHTPVDLGRFCNY